jgi:RNA recognition motif-containing protein
VSPFRQNYLFFESLVSHRHRACSVIEVHTESRQQPFSKGENMGSKIYVGGLPYTTTDAQLQEIFSAHGTVESARVITDKFTGRSKGFGFVEMSSSEEAQKAIRALNGTDLEGRNLTVNEARPQEKRSGFGSDRGGERRGGGGRNRW